MPLTASSPTEIAGTLTGQHLTVGVEEEFLLLDADTWDNAPVADAAREALAAAVRERPGSSSAAA